MDGWAAQPVGSSWKSLERLAPLDPGLARAAEERHEETELRAALPFIQTVCHKPRSHLRNEEYREPVGRVRRISARTVETLACHSEDWQAVTFRGVRPSRLLAQLVEEDLGIYENRALVVLIRRMTELLSVRVAGLRSLLTQLEIAESQGELDRGSRFRRERICLLLKDAFFDQQPAAALVRALYERLELHLRELRSLQASTLLRHARGFAPVRSPLRSTNLFRGNEAYRRVEALWRVWMESSDLPKPPNVDQLLRQRRNRIEAHRRFVALITLRALRSVFSSACETADISMTQPLPLERGWCLRQSASGSLLLEKSGACAAAIIPLCSGYSREQAEKVDAQFERRPRASAPRNLCVWLDAESPEEFPSLPFGVSSSTLHLARHASVSPLRLDSAEPILGFLRETLFAEEWPCLPLRVDLASAAHGQPAAKQPSQIENLNAPPSAERLRQLRRDRDQARACAASVRTELEQVTEQLRRAQIGSPIHHSLTKQKRDLQVRLDDTVKRVTRLSAELEALEAAGATFAFAMRCPCCTVTDTKIVGTRFRCESCGAVWGKSSAGSIFIHPKGDKNPADAFAWGADWIPGEASSPSPQSPLQGAKQPSP